MAKKHVAKQLVRLAKAISDTSCGESRTAKEFFDWRGYRKFDDAVQDVIVLLARAEGNLLDAEDTLAQIDGMVGEAFDEGFEIDYIEKYVDRARQVMRNSKARAEIKKVIKAVESV